MTCEANDTASFRRLHLLLFAVGGIRFAVQASQVEGLLPHPGPAGEPAIWFHEALGYREAPVYHAPTQAVVAMPGGHSVSLIIDAMEELWDAALADIRPFPSILEPYALRKGMWGVLSHGGSLILLLDLQKMLAPHEPAPTTTPC